MILSAHFFQDVEDIEMTAGNEVEPDHVEVRANSPGYISCDFVCAFFSGRRGHRDDGRQ